MTRKLTPYDFALWTALPMAETSHIEGRLQMILDQTRTRRALTRRGVMTAFGLGTAAFVPLAVLRPAAHAQTAVFSQKPGLARASASETFSPTGGPVAVPVELAGVTDAVGPRGKWWNVAGIPLAKPAFDTWEADQHNANGASPGQRGLIFAFRLPQTVRNVTVDFSAPGSFGYSSSGTWPGKMRGHENSDEATLHPETGDVLTLAAHYPVSAAKEPLWVGVASGAWKISLSEIITPTRKRGQTGGNDTQRFLLSPVAETANGLLLTLTTDATDDLATYDVRVVAVDVQGRELLPASIGEESIGKLDQTTARFSLPLAQVKAFRVETRPFVWTEFKDVALQPAQ